MIGKYILMWRMERWISITLTIAISSYLATRRDGRILIARTTIVHQIKRDRAVGTIRLTWIFSRRPQVDQIEAHRGHNYLFAEASWASDSHRMGEIGGNWTAYLTPGGRSGALDRLLFVETLDLHRTARKTHGRSPRSWHDRTAIAVRSSRDCDSFMAESPPQSLEGIHWRIEITINPRSWPNRGVIVIRSWFFWKRN